MARLPAPCFALSKGFTDIVLGQITAEVKKLLPKTTLVLGGAASGKSEFAEGLVISCRVPKTYIATAQVFDAEMQAKVDRHKDMRGAGWDTKEVPGNLTDILASLPDDGAALLDCATMWLNNRLMEDADLAAARSALLVAISTAPGRLVIVSNEVGQGIVPQNALARQFREAQGRLNIALAAQADLVIQVIAGLPNVLKGSLP